MLIYDDREENCSLGVGNKPDWTVRPCCLILLAEPMRTVNGLNTNYARSSLVVINSPDKSIFLMGNDVLLEKLSEER